jgi:copper chaperone NosL
MNTLSKSSVIMLILAGICILSAVYFPIWRIELDAPQYPEGLALLIYANRLGGEVEIINGLNHYIGMKTLHAEEFIEFTVLPYIIGFFGIWAIVVGLYFKSRRSVLILLITFALFGILAMYDFWRWEYEYGHNLDPTAAIIVPGMAYQPPLIGFKQLLNFGAFSIPDLGGWMMLTGGVLIGLVYVLEAGLLNRFLKKISKLCSGSFF